MEEVRYEIIDEKLVVCAAATTTTTTVVETEGESAGVFDTVKRAAGYETNSFDIQVEYRTFSERSQVVKRAVIKQMDTFGKMLDQPFFRDLLKYGPLLIVNFTLSAADPGKEYYVHSSLMKSVDKLRNVAQVHQLGMSLIENLDVHLTFASDKESAKMAQALNTVAKMFNVKVAPQGLNINVGGKKFDLLVSNATDAQAASIRQLFAFDEENFLAANIATPPPQYGAAFVKGTDLDAFTADAKARPPILLYRHHEDGGKIPGHFEPGYLQASKSNEFYAARFHSIPAVTYLQPEMLIRVGDDEYDNLAAVLLPKKAYVAFDVEGKSDGKSYGGEGEAAELSDSDDDDPSTNREQKAMKKRAEKHGDTRRKREGDTCEII